MYANDAANQPPSGWLAFPSPLPSAAGSWSSRLSSLHSASSGFLSFGTPVSIAHSTPPGGGGPSEAEDESFAVPHAEDEAGAAAEEFVNDASTPGGGGRSEAEDEMIDGTFDDEHDADEHDEHRAPAFSEPSEDHGASQEEAGALGSKHLFVHDHSPASICA